MLEAGSPTKVLPKDKGLGPGALLCGYHGSGHFQTVLQSLTPWEHMEPAYGHEEGLREDRRKDRHTFVICLCWADAKV